MKIKLCKDCQYFRKPPFLTMFASFIFNDFIYSASKCAVEQYQEGSIVNVEYLVSGKSEMINLPFASIMRITDCGREGKYWKPKIISGSANICTR